MPKQTQTLGALFDWDGVIIDSHDQHEKSWQLLAAELGTELPEGFFHATFGMRNEQAIPDFLGWANASDTERVAALGNRKEELYRELIRRDGIDPLPGVLPLLEALTESGIPCAVGSSTPMENIDLIMNVTGTREFFQAVVAAADVTRGKPEPDVFLKGAERINRDPGRCVVFEDAHVGIDAGKSAGCKVIAVATTNPIEKLGKADLAVASLEDITVEAIKALFESSND